jgi:hypothetical protein
MGSIVGDILEPFTGAKATRQRLIVLHNNKLRLLSKQDMLLPLDQ